MPPVLKAARAIGLQAVRVRAVGSAQEPNPANRTWRVSTPDGPRMIRRSALSRTAIQVEYELRVLRHLSGLSWPVPEPLGKVISLDGRLWTAFSVLRGRVAREGMDDHARVESSLGSTRIWFRWPRNSASEPESVLIQTSMPTSRVLNGPLA